MISEDALRGYVLEELLAALLKGSGYDLLTDVSHDQNALCRTKGELRIRGRGSDHQFDVLGELQIRIPFSLPVRLFVEAKYRTDPTGLGAVRNALGVLNDVNEHYSTAVVRLATVPYRRFHYRYALFSTSGFTHEAELFAAAQQISLVDISRPAFAWLRRAARTIAHSLITLAVDTGLTTFPVSQMRAAFRSALDTWADPTVPEESFADAATRAMDQDIDPTGNARLPARELAQIAAQAAELDGALFLAFTGSPFLVIAQPDDPTDTTNLAEALRQTSFVDLAFGGTSPQDGEWALQLVGDQQARILRLTTSPLLEGLALGERPEAPGSRAGSETASMIFLTGSEQHEVRFRPVDDIIASSLIDDKLDPATIRRRAERLRPDLTFRADIFDEDSGVRPADNHMWPSSAILELLVRLSREGWPHTSIILQAARQGGRISRAEVYDIAGYPEDRMLRGFTRPPRRITRDLIRENKLSPEAEWPLIAGYQQGVLATHFVVPSEFVDLLT